MRIFVLALFLLFFSCSTKYESIKDIRETPQNALYFVENNKQLINREFQTLLDTYFNRFFFSPWNREKPSYSKQSVSWGFRLFPKREVYGENKRKIDKRWFESLKEIADLENYPSLSKWGITVSNTDLKVFPTEKPIFYSFKKAGEGFPFDYNQNSAVYAGTPVFVSHVSKDREWYLVETPFAVGWIKTKNIALVDREFIDNYMTGKYIAFIKEDIPVLDENGLFRFKGRIGMILPLLKEDKDSFLVYIPVKDTDGYAVLYTASIEKGKAVIKPMPFTQKNIAKVINQTLGKNYGWGGLFQNRDCSANIRDIFVPFGIWLPRNSTAQAKSGLFISLDGLTDNQKEEFIKKSAVPFLTLVWMPGHIMLYVGKKEGKAYVFHNFWGIKTKILNKEGRVIVGKAAITTLRPESDIFFADRFKTFLKRVKGITYIIPPKYIFKY